MRVFSFRVWDTKKSKFEYWEGFNPIIPDRILYNEYNPVQQFTGKYDIENNKIWEGDLVELVFAIQLDNLGNKKSPSDSFGIYEIFYDDFYGTFSIKTHKKNWFANTRENQAKVPMLNYIGIYRVIGNIYENSNILNKV
jgi:uncharacterized phage protein (TIGR01671 family)